MAKRLYDVLKNCNKEEEVKAEFCKFFKMKINALKYTHDALHEKLLSKEYEYGFLDPNVEYFK